jgi:hypothetical protein
MASGGALSGSAGDLKRGCERTGARFQFAIEEALKEALL